MWWLAIPAIILVGKAISSYISSDEQDARARWEHKRIEVQKTIEEHRINIERNLEAAQSSYDFRFLTDLHFSSHRVGDSAHKLLDDARTSCNTLKRMISDSKMKKNELKVQISSATRPEKQILLSEIREITSFVTSIFAELELVSKQRKEMYDEVQRLNLQTRNLKLAIKDRCGDRGKEWYEKLQKRTETRKRFGNA